VFPQPAEISAGLADAAWNCPAATAHRARFPRERPEHAAVLSSWVGNASAELGLPWTPWKTGLFVLHELHAVGKALTVAELTDSLHAEAALAGGGCLDCFGEHELSAFGSRSADSLDVCSASVPRLLTNYGAVGLAEAGPQDTDAMLWLTPLGRMLATSIFVGWAPAPDADVKAVVQRVKLMPHSVRGTMMAPWLARRSGPDAVRVLLTYGEPRAGSTEGWTALVLAADVGEDGVQAWREWALKPGFGVYARTWLGDHGEQVPEQPTDGIWLGIDNLLELMRDNRELVLERLRDMVDLGLPEAVAKFVYGMRASGHPGAERIAELLAELGAEPRT
jgi:hypothetical protein